MLAAVFSQLKIKYMTNQEKFETITKLFAKAMFHGNWQWETPNERVITMLMQELGLYPFTDEDEMIRNTKVDESLYKRALEEVQGRVSNDNSQTDGGKERSPNGG